MFFSSRWFGERFGSTRKWQRAGSFHRGQERSLCLQDLSWSL